MSHADCGCRCSSPGAAVAGGVNLSLSSRSASDADLLLFDRTDFEKKLTFGKRLAKLGRFDLPRGGWGQPDRNDAGVRGRLCCQARGTQRWPRGRRIGADRGRSGFWAWITCLVLCSPRPMGIKTPASGIPVPGAKFAFFAGYDMRLDRGVPVPHYVRDSILERTRTDIEGTCHNQ